MPYYSILQSIYMSFFSKNLYRDVSKNWSINKAYFNLFLVIIIAYIIILLVLKMGDNRYNLTYLFSYHITYNFIILGVLSLVYILPGKIIAFILKCNIDSNKLHKIAIISMIPSFCLAQIFNVNEVFKNYPVYLIALCYLFFGILSNKK